MKINSLGVRRLQSACLILVALLFTQCDKDDNYVYPDVLTDFMDIYTNEEAMVDCIHPDASGMLSLQNQLSGQGLRSDTLYRAVGMYALPDADGSTLAYSVSLVYAEPPIRMGEGMTARMDSLLENKTCCFSEEENYINKKGEKVSVFNNALMLSVPKHPFMQKIIETAFSDKMVYANPEPKQQCVLSTTGPGMITTLYNSLLSEEKENVYIIPAKYVTPFSVLQARFVRQGYNGPEVKKALEEAYAVHYFWGGWL